MKIKIFTSSDAQVVVELINKLVLSKKNIVVVDVKYSTAYNDKYDRVIHSAMVMYRDD